MFIILDKATNIVIVKSPSVEYVPNGIKVVDGNLQPFIIIVDTTNIIIKELDNVPEYIQPYQNKYEDGTFSSIDIVEEPVDEEKAFLAEAVIQLSNEIENLKAEIQTLKGGV